MDFSKFHNITSFIFDVDGVLSDGSLQITESNELLRTVSARDGMGIRLALDAGYNVAIITGGRSAGVEDRFRALGVQDYYSAAHCVDVVESHPETLAHNAPACAHQHRLSTPSRQNSVALT